ncbi:Serine/threonine-protein kinase mph1 [Operophtera brumata]|uniref:Serine/threonine-protein kinase mph1 n=1 Tax=Operophtera brumata TaxID=104452 RepID=A0A0L7KQF5_OPEBR|nr:Serine/threonine-protein kinase mph1 [Operophtera brumata]
MNGNTEQSNSIKFAPMPMSALLANLVPLQTREDSPDCSFSSGEESDGSFGQTVAKKQSPAPKSGPKYRKIKNKEFSTPSVKMSQPKDIKSFISEKKPVRNDQNKENTAESWISNQTYPNKTSYTQNTPKTVITTEHSSTDVKERSVLVPHNYVRTQSTTFRRTPEVTKVPNQVQKTKTPTPKIKTGIRRFTPGSARKNQKKTLQKTNEHNRDRVRCELFTQNQQKDESQGPPLRPEPMSAPTPVPETPINKKPMSMSYSATPSYPQGVCGNNNKKLFKTTTIKDKKYMFIKMLGKGGSSEVYKGLEVSTSCEYAVKCVFLGTDQELAQGYINEVRLLRELQNSDRVIRLYDFEYDRTNHMLRMVLEAGETDLSSFLKARGTGLPPALVLHYWEEMLHAVHYIHEHGMI